MLEHDYARQLRAEFIRNASRDRLRVRLCAVLRSGALRLRLRLARHEGLSLARCRHADGLLYLDVRG
ncbi:MAG: hypothetical protein KDH15_13885 [Rhodocyclaceae bacterium]|nr:hypothetical protein [Rhodocyclaceae bacterium]